MNGLTEILMRWKEPLNTFWRRMFGVLVAIGALAGSITDLLPEIIHNELVPEEWKTPLRMLYAAALFGALLAKLTVSNTQKFKDEKHKAEFEGS